MAIASEKIEVVIGAKALYEATLKKASSDFDKYGKSVVAIFVKIKAAQIALTKAWDLAADAAKFDQQEQAFTNLAASYGANAADIITSLKQVSGQTVSTAAAMDAAGKAMLLGIPAERLASMMEIARASAKITGQTVQEAFNDIAVGIGRQSPMILDNLGITVKLSKAYIEYAGHLGKTVKQLKDAEKKQAFLNAVMKSGKSIVDRVGKSTLTAADAQAIFTAKMQDMKIIAGKVIITVTAGLSGIAFAISKVFAQTLKTVATAIGKIDQLMGKLPFYKATPGILEFADAQGAAAKEADRLMKQSFGVAAAVWKEKEAVEGLAKAKRKAVEDPEEPAAVKAVKDISEAASYAPRLADYQTYLQDKITAHEQAQERIKASEAGTYITSITAAQTNLEAIQQYHQNRIQMAWVSGASQTEIAQMNAQAEVDMEKAKNDAKVNMARTHLQAASGFMNNLFIATGSNNKKMFEASKAFNIGQAVMNTYAGATKAFAQYGWPYGAVAAALVVASGLAQVAQIRSQTMGGGVSAAGGGSGGSLPTGPTVSGDTGAGSLIGTDDNQRGGTFTIHMPIHTVVADKEQLARFAEEDLRPIFEEMTGRDVDVVFAGEAA